MHKLYSLCAMFHREKCHSIWRNVPVCRHRFDAQNVGDIPSANFSWRWSQTLPKSYNHMSNCYWIQLQRIWLYLYLVMTTLILSVRCFVDHKSLKQYTCIYYKKPKPKMRFFKPTVGLYKRTHLVEGRLSWRLRLIVIAEISQWQDWL